MLTHIIVKGTFADEDCRLEVAQNVSRRGRRKGKQRIPSIAQYHVA